MINLTVDAVIDNLNTVTLFVNDFLEQNGCSMRSQVQIDVAIDEIFSNICYYSYKDIGKATVTADLKNGNAVITFEDWGTPYNPLEKDDPDISLSLEEREDGGLGIFIVKKTMDSVSYEYKNGKNILSIVKKL